jgi:selenide,water dikinase
VLVSHATHDDAGVYRLSEDLALVQTVDFFTPVVDDPRTFGAVAAVNALSDVYAMGARPATALNLVAFPADRLDAAVLGAMLQGGRDVMDAAGVAVLGGHSIDDPEPKMGYAVTGIVHPDKIWRNSTAQPGDVLYLTKAIGTGVLVKGIKEDRVEAGWAEAATSAMTTSNQGAAAALEAAGGPSACTDVTGFGLLGHLWEMADGAGVAVHVDPSRVPLLPGALDLAARGGFPAGSVNNRMFFGPHVEDRTGLDEARLGLLFDAVTAGGLLFAVPPERVGAVERSFAGLNLPLHRLGTFREGPPVMRLDPGALT